MIYGRVSVNKDAMEHYDSLTPAERSQYLIQPRVFSVDDEQVWGCEENGEDVLFPMVVQILTCWFFGETRKNWRWLDMMDQAVGSSTEFSPDEEDLKHFGKIRDNTSHSASWRDVGKSR